MLHTPGSKQLTFKCNDEQVNVEEYLTDNEMDCLRRSYEVNIELVIQHLLHICQS